MSTYQPEAGGAALASRGSRLAAVLLDGIIFIGAGVFGVIGAVTNTEPLIAVSVVLWLAILIAQMVLLGTRGQTIGKIALNIRVVDFNTGGHPA